MYKVLIAGGGSGGHVAPAIAAAEALCLKNVHVTIGHSSREIDTTMLAQTSIHGIPFPAVPLSKHPLGFIRFYLAFLRTSKMVRRFIQTENIGCVLSTGGFVAAPALHAARKIGCPTVLLNLDKPPGKANRLAVRWADHVLSTVESSLKSAVLINPPVRQCCISSNDKQHCTSALGLDPTLKTILVTGASQGALTINELLPALAMQYPKAFEGWQILHIAGTQHITQVQQRWNKCNTPCVVVGFIHNMGEAWGAADLAITRGGANTIAEISINSIPSVVMPYPFHQDDHQKANAKPLEKIGGILIATDHKELGANIHSAGKTILQLLQNHELIDAMQKSMSSLAQPNGTETIANTCMKCLKAVAS